MASLGTFSTVHTVLRHSRRLMKFRSPILYDTGRAIRFALPLNDHIDTSRRVAQTSQKLIPGQSNLEETKSIQATAHELGLVGLWSPKSSTFSSSDSIVVEETFQVDGQV